MDILIKDEILKHLNNPHDFDITIFDTIGSTNKELKNIAKKGFLKNHIMVAEMQTGGKGRFDRQFHSPKNSGIYMSLLIKPPFAAEMSVQITAACAVAVARAIQKFTNKSPKIKWVNDLILDNKKICGILTEGAVNGETKMFDWAVVGIGLNLYPPENDFPEELKSIAGYVTDAKRENLRNLLIAEIVNNLCEFIDSLEHKPYLEEYKNRSCVLSKPINIIKNGNTAKAVALDIDNNCRLLVKYENGETEFLSSGEISIKFEK